MPNQINIDEIVPGDFLRRIQQFTESEYLIRIENKSHPTIKNPHEAYGILAEAYVALSGAMKSVKIAMDDSLKTISSPSDAFRDSSTNAYSGCLAVAQAAVYMAVSSENIGIQLLRLPEPTPIEEMIENLDPEDLQIPDQQDNLLQFPPDDIQQNI